MIVGLVVRPGISEAKILGNEIADWVKNSEHQLVLDEQSLEVLGVSSNIKTPQLSKLPELCDIIVTLGGDGTLIGVARFSKKKPPLMLGVNFGTLGFLTEIYPDEALSTLQAAINGEAHTGKRSMIQAAVYREGASRPVFSSQALNEAIVQKGSRDSLVDLDLKVRGEEVMRLRADGMILATPTGSTAYSLAAGGSIAYPSLAVVLVTPICAHSLTSRPFILPLDFDIEVSVPAYDGNVYLSVDGQDSHELLPGDVVKISKSPHKVQFVISPDRSYFEILRNKLNWGIGNKN